MSRFKIIIFYFVLFFICFFIVEIGARIALANKSFYSRISQAGEDNASAIWRQEWVKRHQGDGKGIKIEFNYALHHPTRGWQLKPNLKDQVEFNNKKVSTDSKGVRGKGEYSYEKAAGKTRILVFGDSFTFGTEVSDDETYAYYLQKLLPQAEVLNMGVFGYGHDQMLLYLQEEGVKYHPDIVILGYLSCDDSRNLLSFRDYAKSTFALRGDRIVLRNIPVPTPEQTFRGEFWRSKFADLAQILQRQYLLKTGQYKVLEDKITKKILSEFVSTVRNTGAVPVFAYLEGIRDRADLELDKKFFDYWKDKRVGLIYAAPYKMAADQQMLKEMGAQGTIYFKREYGHFSPRENEIIALAIADTLKRTGLVK